MLWVKRSSTSLTLNKQTKKSPRKPLNLFNDTSPEDSGSYFCIQQNYFCFTFFWLGSSFNIWNCSQPWNVYWGNMKTKGSMACFLHESLESILSYFMHANLSKITSLTKTHTHTQLLLSRELALQALARARAQTLLKWHAGRCGSLLPLLYTSSSSTTSFVFEPLPRRNDWHPGPFVANENTPCLLCIQWPRAIGLQTCYCKPPRVPPQIVKQEPRNNN